MAIYAHGLTSRLINIPRHAAHVQSVQKRAGLHPLIIPLGQSLNLLKAHQADLELSAKSYMELNSHTTTARSICHEMQTKLRPCAKRGKCSACSLCQASPLSDATCAYFPLLTSPWSSSLSFWRDELLVSAPITCRHHMQAEMTTH